MNLESEERPPERTRDGHLGAREQLAPETTIAVAALFIAVAGLARTIGGFAAAIAAAAIGAAVASVLVVPLVRILARARQEEARHNPHWLTLALTVALVITATAFTGLLAYDAVRIDSASATRSAIRTAIVKSYDAEVSWSKDPTSDKTALLERWFVPVAAGGERLRIIEAAIARLRRCHREIGSAAATTTFVSSITVVGADAEAHTVQSLYQPIFDLRNGKWIARPLAPQDLSGLSTSS
jgi:predicted PurR-regulated permease PerM